MAGLTLTLRLPRFSNPPGSHVINTNCSAVHTRQALCCKMAVEYDKFIESGRKYVVAVPLCPLGEPRAEAGPTHPGHRGVEAPNCASPSLVRVPPRPPGGSAMWMTTTT